MMILYFKLNGITVFKCEAEAVPPPGAEVVFRSVETMGDIVKGTLSSARIAVDHLARFDFDTL